MDIKSELLKNIPINFLVILLSYINFAPTFSLLLLNKRLLLFKTIGIAANIP